MSTAIVPLATAVPAVWGTNRLVDSFLSGKSEMTLRAYRTDLETFASFMGADNIDEAAQALLTRSHGEANGLALDYKACLMDKGLSSATVNRRLASLRSLITLARTLGLVSWTLEVKNLKSQPYRDTKGPGVPAFRRMLLVLKSRGDRKAVRDFSIVRLLYDIALRRGEVVSLDVDDVDLDAGTIQVLGKGRREKIRLALPEPTKEALVAWLEIRGEESGPLFTNCDRAGKGDRLTGNSIYRLVKSLGSKIGVMSRPHGLRHTAITEACKVAQANGYALEEVLDFSRHSDISTLLIYRDRERDCLGKLASLVADSV